MSPISRQMEGRMTEIRNNLGKILKQRRVMIPLTLQELAHASGVSPSHLGRIERGDRLPSARILRKIANPLGFEESELFYLAGFLSPEPPVAGRQGEHNVGQLDPHVAAVLSKEPVEVQHAMLAIFYMLKYMAKGIVQENAGSSTGGTAGARAKVGLGC